jgi:prepilin-type N-terminal cleavage/methylation domain-containing protein
VRKGFTLVEVLVALVVTVAALTVLVQGFISGGRASVVAQHATRAALVGQRVIVELETGALPLDRGGQGVFPDEPDFAWRTESAADEPGLVLVTVTVGWIERNQERTYVLSRLMRERPAGP